MKYRRKTVDRWKFDAIAVMLTTIAFAMAMFLITNAVRQAFARDLVSPASDLVLVEKQVEKPVAVYTHPKTIEDKIKSLWPNDWETAIKVFTCESGLNPTAYNENTNGSIDVGIAQVNSIHGVSAKMLTDVDVNLAVARQIYDNAGGWTPWVCYTRGLHE